MKNWELIADKLSASGLSWGRSSEIDGSGRVLYTAEAYRKDGKRFSRDNFSMLATNPARRLSLSR